MAYKAAYIWNGTTFDNFGVQAVQTLNDYAKLSPSPSQTITNTTLTSPTISGGTINSSNISFPVIKSIEEIITISALAATGTVNFDCLTQGILYYTASASANFTLNFRGDGSTTFNNIIATGASFTATFLNTNGVVAYYPNVFQIDGNAVTPKWSGGSAPSSGNASAIDAYSFTIIKTASATFTVLAGAVKFS